MVLQMSCRDRNRIALQGDLLGAAALGVKNILCITGDDVTAGDQSDAKRVFDFDSMHLLHTATIMRDKQHVFERASAYVPPHVLDWRRRKSICAAIGMASRTCGQKDCGGRRIFADAVHF